MHPNLINPTDATLQNRYSILKLIGQGGFGKTFLALDNAHPDQPRCVIKQLFRHADAPFLQQKAIGQFQQEVQQLAALGTHPQIPQLLDSFEQDGYHFLVQEWIEGQNLEQILTERGAFSETEIRQLLNDLLPVLQFIHNHQIIHRDIKPANIIRRQSTGQLVLVDFGAAKCTTQAQFRQTETQIGSAEYVAPEQLRGKAEFASDLYSLGVTCLRLLTHLSPFDLIDSSENVWVWRKALTRPINPSLAALIDTLLSPATRHRYQSAKAALKDLHTMPLSQPSEPDSSRLPIPSGYAAIVFDASTQNWFDIAAEPEGWDCSPKPSSGFSPRLLAAIHSSQQSRTIQTVLPTDCYPEWVWRIVTLMMMSATAGAALMVVLMAIAPHPVAVPAQTPSIDSKSQLP